MVIKISDPEHRQTVTTESRTALLALLTAGVVAWDASTKSFYAIPGEGLIEFLDATASVYFAAPEPDADAAPTPAVVLLTTGQP